MPATSGRRPSRAWQEAEEIAEISDTLLLPEPVSDWLRRHAE